MMNWLKSLMLFRLMIVDIQIKKVIKTQKLKILKKNPDKNKYITTQKLNKLTAENFAKRFKQEKLVTIIDRIIFKQHVIKKRTKFKKYKYLFLSYLRGQSCFQDDGTQIFFCLFQPIYKHFKNIANNDHASMQKSK